MYFLIPVHNYTKIKGPDSGGITSLPNIQNVINLIVISVIAQNKSHAHHETHLHTMKVVTILIPSFHGLR